MTTIELIRLATDELKADNDCAEAKAKALAQAQSARLRERHERLRAYLNATTGVTLFNKLEIN